MSRQSMQGLNEALARAAYHLNNIPGINRITLKRKDSGAVPAASQNAPDRAEQIGKVLYDSPDMQKYL